MSVRGETRSLQSGGPGAAGGTLRRLWPRRTAPVDVLHEGAYPYVVLKRDQLYRRLLALGDMLATTGALLVAVLVLGDGSLKPLALLIAPLTLLVVKTLGLYDRDQHLLHKSTLDESPQLFLVATVFVLLVWLAAPLCIDGSLTRLQVAGFWFLLFALLVLARAVMRRVAGHLVATERCLVIGDTAIANRIVSKMGRSVLVRANVVGRIPMSGRETIDEEALALPPTARAGSLAAPFLGTVQELPEVVADHMIHRVIIAPGAEDSDELLDLIRAAKVLGVKVSIVPGLFEVVGSSVAFDEIEGLALLGMRPYGLSASSALLKRSFDLAWSALLLTVLAPLFAAIALAIKLTSRGPVFFRQPRIGQHDQAFDMLKFRTMCEDAEDRKPELQCRNEADGLFKIADDPRITRVGRLLRRTSLDELPQLINVLRGEMSLVGPRPLIPEEDAMIDGLNRRRLRMPPGMTGQWQILGSARVPLREMVKIDYLYGANWSLWGDLKILVRTAAVVLGRRGL
jgi:exopolysaccharide biosynthesis polyprenyl glycosylphosphotransferase